MRRIILVFLIFSTNILFAKTDVDSLINIYKTSKIDTVKISVLMNICRHFNNANPDSSLYYLNKLETIALQLNDSRGLAGAKVISGIRVSQIGDFEKSNEILSEAIEFSQSKGENEFHAEAYLTKGINFQRMGKYDKAMFNILKSIDICKKYKFDDMLIRNFISLGLVNSALKQYQEAIEYYHKAINSIGSNKQKLGILSIIYNNLASIYVELNNIEEAIECSDMVIKIDEQLNDPRGLAIAYHNRAAIHYNLKQYDKSLQWFDKSLAIKEKMKNKIGIATTSLGMAEVYKEKKEYSKAADYVFKAIEIYKSSNSLANLMNSYELLGDIYKQSGDYKNAFEYLEKYQELKDSILTEKNSKEIAEINAKFQLAKKETENEQLRSEASKQFLYKMIYILVIGIVAISAIALLLKYRSLRKMNAVLNESREKIEVQNIELETLNNELRNSNFSLSELNSIKDKFFSIIAHDLKGPISTHHQLMKMLINDYFEYSHDERMEMLNVLHDSSKNTYLLLENLLMWSSIQRDQIVYQPDNINAKKIISGVIDNTISIAKIKSILIKNQVDENAVINADPKMFSFIVRNLVSNAIKYSHINGEITISANFEESRTVFCVSDNGIGMPEEVIGGLFNLEKSKSRIGTNNEKGTGLGLILIKEFLDKIGGEIWVESEVNKGSTFYFSLSTKN